MSLRNRGHVLHGKRDLRLEDLPVPELKDGEVLLAVEWVGLCGSDVHQWADGGIGEKQISGPFVLGHEASARVLHTNGTHLAKGDLVAVEPGIGCARCAQCRSGRYNLCPAMRFFSTLKPPNDGILCHLKAHPASLCHKLPAGVSSEGGALAEPLSVAVQAVRRCGVGPGDAVLVCGAGPVGLLCALVAGQAGAHSITITDVSDSRLSTAASILPGVRTVNVTRKDVGSLSPSPGRVVECTGVGASQRAAMEACAPGGVVVLVGLAAAVTPVPVHRIAAKELDVRGVFRYANCYPAALELLRRGAVPVEAIVTARFAFHDAEEALETARKGQGMKVLVSCRPSNNELV